MSLMCPHGRVEQTIPCPLCEAENKHEEEVNALHAELARVTAERDTAATQLKEYQEASGMLAVERAEFRMRAEKAEAERDELKRRIVGDPLAIVKLDDSERK